MKFLTTLIISLLAFSYTGLAQITITNEIFPVEGDSLLYAFDNQPEAIEYSAEGGNQVWGFSNLQNTGTRNQVFLSAAIGEGSDSFPSANLFFEAGGGLETYVKVSDTKLEYVGVFGNDPMGLGVNIAAAFSPSIIEKSAPLNYQDESQNSFKLTYVLASSDLPDTLLSALPIVPDSFRIRFDTERENNVDAWGTLSIPGGTYEVLRQKRVENRTIRLDAKVPIFGWQDITDLVLPLIEDAFSFPLPTEIATTSYHYFSNEAKETIAILYLTNDTIRTVQFKNNNITTALNEPNFSELSIKIFPNPTANFINIELNDSETDSFVFRLFDTNGRILIEKTISNSFEKNRINLKGFLSGIYNYGIYTKTQKIIDSGQLIVTK